MPANPKKKASAPKNQVEVTLSQGTGATPGAPEATGPQPAAPDTAHALTSSNNPPLFGEAAASNDPNSFPDLDAMLDTFQTLTPEPTRILRPGQPGPWADISAVGRVETNAACRSDLQQAAVDRKLPSTQFEALHIVFSAPFQSFMAYPLAKYKSGDPHVVKVDWSAREASARWSMQELLVAAGWATPEGFTRRVEVKFYRNHPRAGSVIVLNMKQHKLQDADSRKRQQKKNKAKQEAAQAGQTGAPTQTPGNQAQAPGTHPNGPGTQGGPAAE